MSGEAGDTRDRSLAHWSEVARAEMDAFYQVATLDYRELAVACDWDALLPEREAPRSPLRILDVACGSGKFPAALRAHTALGSRDAGPLMLDLLDPSSFSIREARASLAPPFIAGREFECTLQAAACDGDRLRCGVGRARPLCPPRSGAGRGCGGVSERHRARRLRLRGAREAVRALPGLLRGVPGAASSPTARPS